MPETGNRTPANEECCNGTEGCTEGNLCGLCEKEQQADIRRADYEWRLDQEREGFCPC